MNRYPKPWLRKLPPAEPGRDPRADHVTFQNFVWKLQALKTRSEFLELRAKYRDFCRRAGLRERYVKVPAR